MEDDIEIKDPKPALVFGLVLGALGLVFTAFGTFGLSEILTDSDWVLVNAAVVSVDTEPFTFEGKRSGGGSYEATGKRVKVAYRYAIDGKTFESTRYSRLDAHQEFLDPEKAEPRLAALATGNVRAWVNPNAHAESVLAKSERVRPLVVLFVGVVLLGIAGLQFFSWGRRKRLKAQLAAIDAEG